MNNTPHAKLFDAASNRHMAIFDVIEGLKKPQLWWHFAIHDIKQRYKRSTIGPFWLTLSMGIFVTALGIIFSQIFNQPIEKFLPYVAAGLIFWSFISAILNDSGSVFQSSESYLKNVPMPVSVHYYRMLARNFIILIHNIIILIFVFPLFDVNWTFSVLLVIPGFLLVFLLSAVLGSIIAVFSARYRDVPQIVNSVIQVIFFVTPIFWSTESLPTRPSFIQLNPIFHMIELVRAPLLGSEPELLSWIVVLCSLFCTIPVAFWLYRAFWFRIPYWV